MSSFHPPPEDRLTLRIVVVGPCASGKSTLVLRLREQGLDARVCGQEHSGIMNLWKKMHPDLLVALYIDLETLRTRRQPSWPANLYQVQMARLADAYAIADLTIDTAATPPDQSAQLVVDAVQRLQASST